MLTPKIIKESLFSLKRNKMRTFLSTLGIIIGIASVITLLSLGEAAQAQITSQLESLGVNQITLSAGRSFNIRDQNQLTLDDVEYLRQEVFSPYFLAITPLLSSSGTLVYQSNTTTSSLTGADEAYFTDPDFTDKLAYGRMPTAQEINDKAKVLVIGYEIADELFGSSPAALSQKIKFQNQFWQIIGVLEETESLTGEDTTAYTPIGTLALYVPGASLNSLSSIRIEATSSKTVSDTQNFLKYIFMKRRGVTNPDDLNLRLSSAQDMIESLNTMLGTVTALLAGIAAISLLVGGIGIMNIMLVSVTERTREIGLRKALGAKRKIIIAQFLTESIILTLIGGLVGFFLGLALAYIGTKLMSVTFVVSWLAVFLSISVSSLIGLLFGIYPAAKAAKLQPIEALRYD